MTGVRFPVGICTLRAAIENANAHKGAAEIKFAIGAGGPATIALSSALPPILYPMVIDGTTEPGFDSVTNVPLIDVMGKGTFPGLTFAGGSSTLKGLVLNGFSADVALPSGKNVVEGNYLGTDSSGKVGFAMGKYPTLLEGVAVTGSFNTIGGTTPAQRNIISGHYFPGAGGNGVHLYLPASKNLVEGNYIGTDVTGTDPFGDTKLGNSLGVCINGFDNTVGGTLPAQRNILSGNVDAGVFIDTTGKTNLIEGNYVGTDVSGSKALGNGVGVYVLGNANAIGGPLPAGGGGGGASPLIALPPWGGPPAAPDNLISGNVKQGVLLTGGFAKGNLVQSNYIGTNPTGLLPLANGLDGVAITLAATANTVGGLPGKGNLLSGNGGNGVLISDAGTKLNVVLGNYAGTTLPGKAALPNAKDGVAIAAGATANTVGGHLAAGTGNLLSGNGGNGASLTGLGTALNVVLGNYIGPDVSGKAALANAKDGVAISGGATANTVGGTLGTDSNLLSGNGGNGASIFGAGTSLNEVLGNYVGTQVDGTTALANAKDGVAIGGGADTNTVGGSWALGKGNVISGNSGNGVSLSGGAFWNVVQGNYVGTDAAGKVALGNGDNGVKLATGAFANTVGGPVAAGVGNVISANGANGNSGSGEGVAIVGPGTDANVVQGNYIGTDATGTKGLGNSTVGVCLIAGVAGNKIGGPGAGNVISDSGGAGVLLSGTGTKSNLVQGNFIGTSADGSDGLGNAGNGVTVAGGAFGNTVGGPADDAGNVISDNALDGVLVSGGATGNLVQGNLIGTNKAGTEALGNAGNGVTAAGGAGGNKIGDAGAKNVISGNGHDGVRITGLGTAGNSVLNNYIGTNAAGTAALGNGADGVEVLGGAGANLIASKNVISGNKGVGVLFSGAGTKANTVQGNYIGTNAAGTASLPNTSNGVQIDLGASSNFVGGKLAAERNVISGNGGDGVRLNDRGTKGNLVTGNYIGLNAAGTAALGNAFSGVEIFNGARSNTIGGAAAGEGNVISGNGVDGVHIENRRTAHNLLLGNYVGTDFTGTKALGNLANGVEIDLGAHLNTLGGPLPGQGNVICANAGDGVALSGAGTSKNLLQGNHIGTNASGATDLGNLGHGVRIDDGANNTLGGIGAGVGNVLAYNSKAGVAVLGAASTGNGILGDLIFANGGLGIDLGDDGVTPNGPNPGVGPNNLQNYPVLSTATVTGGSTTITGTLTSAPGTTFRIEPFSSDTADPSGYGQGQTFLGFVTVTTDATGAATFSFTVTADLTGESITATATDPGNNTSEFSLALLV
jgi:hypothetical protein